MIIREELHKTLLHATHTDASRWLRDNGLDVAEHAQEPVWKLQVVANDPDLVKDFGRWSLVRSHPNYLRAALAILFPAHAAELVPVPSDPPLAIQALNNRQDITLADLFELSGLSAPKDLATWRAPDGKEVPRIAQVKGLTHLGSCMILAHNGVLALAVHAHTHFAGVVHNENLIGVNPDTGEVIIDSDVAKPRRKGAPREAGMNLNDVFALLD